MAAKKQQRNETLLTTRAAVAPATLNEEARTVEVTFTTGADVVRYDWSRDVRYRERLSMAPEAVRLDRLNAGAPVLNTHSSYDLSSQLGVVESAAMRDGVGVATLRFSEREEVAPVWRDVATGILRNVSVGYVVHQWRVTPGTDEQMEIREAIDWEPFEISLVPIPADAGAQVRVFEDATARASGEENRSQVVEDKQEQTGAQSAPIANPKDVLAAERARVAEINSLCRKHGVESDRFIQDGTSLDAVRAAILESIGERQRATQISSVQVGNVERADSMKRDAEAALLVRAGHKAPEGTDPHAFGSARLLDIARTVIGASRSMSDIEVTKRAMVSADFSTIIGSAGQKLVLAGYNAEPLAHQVFAAKSTNPDFKASMRIASGAGGALAAQTEGNAYATATTAATGVALTLGSYGKIVGLSRQLMMSDDFGLVAKTLSDAGKAAVRTEAAAVWAAIVANANNFFGTHGSFDNEHDAASGSIVALTTLANARQYFRSVTGVDGTAMGVPLKFVVCGPTAELAWEQILSPLVVPTSSSGVVPASLRGAQLLVMPQIVDNASYFFSAGDHIEYATLNGTNGPRVETRVALTCPQFSGPLNT